MHSVLFLMPMLDAPSELFMQRQIRMLAKANVLEAIAVTNAGGTGQWSGIPVYSLTDTSLLGRVICGATRRLGFKPHYPTCAEMLTRVLKKLRADTILCQYGTFAVRLQSALETASQRLFIHVHGVDTHEQLCPVGYKGGLKHLAERATIICNSQETYTRLINWGIPSQRLVVKYMGVEVPKTPVRRNRSTDVTILQLGRLVDCKSPDRTIRAFELACDQGLQGQLIIAGDGPLKTTCDLLRVRSKWRDRIQLLGAVTSDEGEKLRAEADIFTQHAVRGELTGQVEAFGVTIVEAMVASLPVVSCRIGGIVETVADCETGILIEPGDVEAQAAAFLKLACDPDLRRRMGEAGWRRAKEHFSWEKEQRELLAILGIL
jgi:colanic acid/amylovoran biosynthesis glycosyltransferase